MNNIICHKFDATKNGITFESAGKKIHINFDDCAKNFCSENGKEFGKCVATRDIVTLSFAFYTCPKTIVIFKNCLFKDFVIRKSANRKFLEVQNAIVEAGYTSYDLS